ncbi:hypothetical protein BpHYR1_012486 [Brachionus plicatilis]|uniref:Uncharacterized protein n=1 Tax=Brachionus plicatilis TaxID=10195 RepID=A0A3M7SWC6_BRAPC|nr:hypothetical protein BpHYR1_012486 [Brachionus plicatilis]
MHIRIGYGTFTLSVAKKEFTEFSRRFPNSCSRFFACFNLALPLFEKYGINGGNCDILGCLSCKFTEKKYLFIKSDLKQDIVRKSTETDLKNFFLKFNIPTVNKKIPKIEYIKTLILKPEEGTSDYLFLIFIGSY